VVLAKHLDGDLIYAAFTVDDIQRVADLYRLVYDRLDGASR